MTPAHSFHPFPALSTKRLELRMITPADVKEIFFLRSDPRMMQYINKTLATTMDDALNWIHASAERAQKNEAVNWGLTEKGSDKVIGYLCFFNIRTEHHRAELGYALHPGHQYKGYMSEAVSAVIDYGFSRMHLHSIEANVNPGNAASINLLQKLGFVREGYFKENYFFKGEYLDTAVYSLLAPRGPAPG
jgi:ribosomal-protein-alanine N-acetyltransferase